MYHEADYEMEQLLSSIAKIDEPREDSRIQFEAHIFLDDGVRGNFNFFTLTSFTFNFK